MDKKAFQETYSDFGTEMCLSIIDIFFEEYSEKLTSIKRGIEESNFSSIIFHSHKLKGSCSAFFDIDSHHLAGQIESYAKANQIDGMMQKYEMLAEAVLRLVAELNDLKNELKNG